MKSKTITLVFSVLWMFLLASCQKISTPTEESKALFGEWTYLGSSGGFSGAGGSTRFEQGDWVKFTERGGFCVYNNTKKKSQKRYKIELKNSISSTTPRSAIVYANGTFETFIITGNTLYISDEKYDGYGYSFLRK